MARSRSWICTSSCRTTFSIDWRTPFEQACCNRGFSEARMATSLAAAAHQLVKFGPVLRDFFADARIVGFAKLTVQTRVDAVVLGQPVARAGKVANLARVDQRHRQAGVQKIQCAAAF